MNDFSGYAGRPFSFVLRYCRQRSAAHLSILFCIVAAVACSVGTQYGVKSLVDALVRSADVGLLRPRVAVPLHTLGSGLQPDARSPFSHASVDWANPTSSSTSPPRLSIFTKTSTQPDNA